MAAGDGGGGLLVEARVWWRRDDNAVDDIFYKIILFTSNGPDEYSQIINLELCFSLNA